MWPNSARAIWRNRHHKRILTSWDSDAGCARMCQTDVTTLHSGFQFLKGKTMSQSDWQLRSVAKASHVPSWAAPSAPSFQDRLPGWCYVTHFIQNVSWVGETTDVPDDFVDSMLVLYFACCYYMNGLHRIISIGVSSLRSTLCRRTGWMRMVMWCLGSYS